jgi:hypothetical protein
LPALASGPSASAREPQPGCSVAGAIPNDGLDDRVAIQEALTSQKCAYLPAGVYDIVSIPFTPPARRPTMMLEASGARLFGDGPSTVLRFRGSDGGADWVGILMTRAGSALHDVSIDTTGISETDEQTHAVKILGPATEAEIARVSIDHPTRMGPKSGDCIQVVGFDFGREIVGVKIRENQFLHCSRSGVAVHSGTRQLEISDNRFEDVRNSDLDFEGTGDTSDVLIEGNTFTMSPGLHGVGAIMFQLVEEARVTDNVFNGRGLDVFQSDDIEIDHNEITQTQLTGEPVIFIHKDCARTRIIDNSITRESSAGVGGVIVAGPHNSGTPDHLTIEGNQLLQRTSAHVVATSGLVGLYVRHNAIVYSGDVANAMAGVFALGSANAFGIRTTDVHVDANTFEGPLQAAVSTSGSYFGAGMIETSGNVASGATFGIWCDNFGTQGGVLGPITSTGDSWPAPLCGPEGFVEIDENVVEEPPSEGEGGSGGGPPGPDTTAPVLRRVSLSRTRFAVTRAAAGMRAGTVLRFSSSEAGTLSIRIERVRPPQGVNRPVTLTRAIGAGPNRLALSGIVGGRPMKPGSYRLTLRARDAAGNRSKATLRTFTILAG